MIAGSITLVAGPTGPRSGYRSTRVEVRPTQLQPNDKVLEIREDGVLVVQRQVPLTDDEMQLVKAGWAHRGAHGWMPNSLKPSTHSRLSPSTSTRSLQESS